MTYRSHVVLDSMAYGAALLNISASTSGCYVPVVAAGIVNDAWGTISAAITSANAVVTVNVIPGGTGTPVAIGTITVVQVGSGAGVTYQMARTGSEIVRSVSPGDSISFVTDGGSSTTSIGTFVAVVDNN